MADQTLDFRIRLSAEDRAQAGIKAAAAAIKEVEEAQKRANAAAQAWATLGARSGAEIRAEMERVKAALNTIRNAGTSFNEIGRAIEATNQRLKALSRELAGVEKPITGIERLFAKVTQAFFALQIVLKAGELVTAADNFERLKLTLAQSEGSTQAASRALTALFQISKSASVPIEALTISYQRYTRSVAAMGGSQEETLRFTEALAKALRLSNATAQETGSVMRQLSQAFNKGKLNGDEFVSVSENGGRVLDYLARQLGKTRGELQEMSKAGELTDRELLKLGNALEQIRKEFDSLPKNLADAWVDFQTDIIQVLGDSRAFQGVMSTLSEALLLLGRNIDVALVAMTALGAAWAASGVSLTLLQYQLGATAGAFIAATTSVKGFTAALWAMSKNPYAWAIAALIAYVGYDLVSAWGKADAAQTSTLDNLKQQLHDIQTELNKLDADILRGKERLESLFADLGKQYAQLGGLTDERAAGEIAALQERYDRELQLLKGLVRDKKQVLLEETDLVIRQVEEEYAIYRRASAQKLNLIRQEYTEKMRLAQGVSISANQRGQMEVEAQATLSARLKELWEQDAENYGRHLERLESLALEHLKAIQDLEAERSSANRMVEKELEAIREQSYSAEKRLFNERKSEEAEIAALKAKVAQGDQNALKELIALYKEQAKAAEAVSQGLIIQPGKDGGWYSREQLKLIKQIEEAQKLLNQGLEEQIRKRDQARIAAEVELELMKAQRDEILEATRNLNAQLEQGALLKIGADQAFFQQELDQLVKWVKERDDAKLRIGVVEESIKQIEAQAKQALDQAGPMDLKAQVQIDSPAQQARILQEGFPAVKVNVEPEVANPSAAEAAFTKAMAGTTAKVKAEVDPKTLQEQVNNLEVKAPAQLELNDPSREVNQVEQALAGTEVQMAIKLDDAAAKAAINDLNAALQNREVLIAVKIQAEEALAKVQALNGLSTQSTHTVISNANEALREIWSLNGIHTHSYHTIHVKEVRESAAGGFMGLAQGGMPRYYPRRHGLIRGPGTETSDSIPAMLSRGEFVLRAAAVRQWGLGFLYALNRGFLPELPRFATGGAVLPTREQPGLPEMAINLSVQGGQPLRLLSSRETAKDLAKALRNLERGR